jgi:hypothetical protein
MLGERGDGFDERRIAFDVEGGVFELCVDLRHGFGGIVLEEFFANLVPSLGPRVLRPRQTSPQRGKWFPRRRPRRCGRPRVRAGSTRGLRYRPTEYFVNAPPAWTSEFGPSAA